MIKLLLYIAMFLFIIAAVPPAHAKKVDCYKKGARAKIITSAGFISREYCSSGNVLNSEDRPGTYVFRDFDTNDRLWVPIHTSIIRHYDYKE